jgi:predicted RNase H-like nuclease (RuvC/YqgF family)
MADNKKEPKPKKAWWVNQSRNFSGGISYGDPMPENVPQSRLDELYEVEDIAYEEPEEKEEVTASQVDKLREKVVDLQQENADLKKQIEKTPKGVQAAKAEVKKLKAELKTFKESAVKSDPAKTQELAEAKARIVELEEEAKKAVSTEEFNKQFDELDAAKKTIEKLEADVEKLTNPGGD